MLCFYDNYGRVNWTTQVKILLCKSGFGHVWYFQGVGNESSFIQLFKQRLNDMYFQTWCSNVVESDKLRTYRCFKFN